MDCDCGSDGRCGRHPGGFKKKAPPQDYSLAEAIATELTGMWYELVGLDHHKDRDCHWGIEQRWSYGDPPTWRVTHDGYVAGCIHIKGLTSYGGALRALIETLVDTIRENNKMDPEYAAEWAGPGVVDATDRISKRLEDMMPAYRAALADLPQRVEID